MTKPGDARTKQPTDPLEWWVPLRITAIYIVVGLLWIGLSDHAAVALAGSFAESARFQTIKGSFYVLATGAMLLLLIRRYTGRLLATRRALEVSERRHRELLDEAPIAIVLLSGGRIEYRNKVARSLLGDVPENTPFSTLVAPESREFLEDILRKPGVACKAESRPELLLTATGAAGPRLVSVFACESPVRAGLVQLALQDVTELRRLETIAAQAQKMEAVGQLATHVTHEFNNVLTAILGHAAIARASVPPELAGPITGIESVGKLARGLTRSMLSLARARPSDRSPELLSPLLTEAVELIHGVLPRSVRVHLDTSLVRDLSCTVDASQIKQAILNLAINARDAMPGGGHLRIAARPQAGPAGTPGVTIDIVDTGSGMTTEVRDKLFTPFFTTKPQGRGSGLGLTISRSIIEEHQGSISAASVPGNGSTFSIWLPADRAPAAGAPSSAPTYSRRLGLILVGEDNAGVRDVICHVLRGRGHDVIPVADGGDVIEAIDRHAGHLSLLLLDVDLPSTSGVDCLAHARTRSAAIPCLFTSGGAMPALSEELAAHTRFLAKPFAMDDLLDAVDALLAECPPPTHDHAHTVGD
ncbi:MAG: response regulator [Leptolyngbya sp. PLA1]|nr:response regulator [Leptolyngbya sp. PLA1]